ncbi:MAG: hypothetical protein HY056_14250 [Proteobacteria bacterium]|nr:hypothetical protein [Pseudomonadota bacterium]
MPVTSMVRLARVDFATTDPAALRAAVKVPVALRLHRDGVHLRIKVKVDGEKESASDFQLREETDSAAAESLKNERGPKVRIMTFRFEPSELARLAAFRADILQRKRKGGGSLQISIEPRMCRIDELPAGPVRFTTFLRTAETGEFIALARDVDLRALDPKRDIAAAIPACE